MPLTSWSALNPSTPEHAGGLPVLHDSPKLRPRSSGVFVQGLTWQPLFLYVSACSQATASVPAIPALIGILALSALPVWGMPIRHWHSESSSIARAMQSSPLSARSGDIAKPAVRYYGSPKKLFWRLESAVSRPSIHVLECYESSYDCSQEDCALRDYR